MGRASAVVAAGIGQPGSSLIGVRQRAQAVDAACAQFGLTDVDLHAHLLAVAGALQEPAQIVAAPARDRRLPAALRARAAANLVGDDAILVLLTPEQIEGWYDRPRPRRPLL